MMPSVFSMTGLLLMYHSEFGWESRKTRPTRVTSTHWDEGGGGGSLRAGVPTAACSGHCCTCFIEQGRTVGL